MVKYEVSLQRSPLSDKKYLAIVNGKKVHFGEKGAKDYTTHSRSERDDAKKSYLARHRGGDEKWGLNGIEKAGFWSRWILWNETTISASIRYLENKYTNLNIINHI